MSRDSELSMFFEAVSLARFEYEYQRRGQVLFNVLASRRPDLARMINGTSRDPFYDDARYDDALEWIKEHW